jgi:CubicO group peptidase (beta-lactamase class C family)
VAPGFGHVADAFAANFRDRGEVGAACCVYHRGEKVVDLWGGVRDRGSGALWEEDTMLVVFSTTKGVAAAACALAVSRGYLSYDDPIARHWPEFAMEGKQDITLGDLLSHRAGLSHLDRRIGLAELCDPERLAELLARQAPVWQPGRRWGYHAMTFGLYLGEVMRQADPERRTLGRFLASEIAAPLGLGFHIGLPPEVPSSRIARLELPGQAQVVWGARRLPRSIIPRVLNPFSRLHRSMRVAKGFNPNDRKWLEPECASATGVGEVRALARLYSCLATGGGELGFDRAAIERLEATPVPPPEGVRDHVFGIDMSWGLGFVKPGPVVRFGSGPRAFGMPGLGGSFAFADPDLGLGYAYAPSRLGILPFNDPRETSLRAAVYRAVGSLS